MTVRFRGKDESEYITRPFAQRLADCLVLVASSSARGHQDLSRSFGPAGRGSPLGCPAPGRAHASTVSPSRNVGVTEPGTEPETGRCGTIRRVRFRIEHYRAVDVPGSALGYEFTPTGRVEEVDAHDEEDAAAMALTVAGDEPDADGPVAYDPGSSLYAVPGDDEAVRVTPVET